MQMTEEACQLAAIIGADKGKNEQVLAALIQALAANGALRPRQAALLIEAIAEDDPATHALFRSNAAKVTSYRPKPRRR
jgi:hypothetical protein